VCVQAKLSHWVSNITTTTTTTVLRPFVQDHPGEPVPEETFTQSPLSWSATNLYQLPPSTVIHSIIPLQFTCLTVFFTTSPVLLGLPFGLEPSSSYFIHFITHCFLFATNVYIIATCFAAVLRLCHLFLVSLSTLYLESICYLNVTHPSDHFHLCLLKCHLIFFPWPGRTSMQHTMLHTSVIQPLLIHTSVLQPSGHCPGLPEGDGTRTNLDFTKARDCHWQ